MDKVVRYPYIPGGLTYGTNGAGHQYNGLTFQANRTYKSGLTYQFAYTLARDIGDLCACFEDSCPNQYERTGWAGRYRRGL